ncbi:MAG: outer membrane protein assembly factor BamE domain-containing protein [Gammaproteobacteria bacterium]
MNLFAYSLHSRKSRLIYAALLIASLAPMSGCLNIGEDFPATRVMEIQVGKTTINDIQAMFGPPFRVGSESGVKTWSYVKGRYNLFGPATNQDLLIRFDSAGIVKSYSFNTTTNK